MVTASYDGDYSDNVITVNISNISGFDSATRGEQELTITYGGQIAKFTVKVIVPITDLTGVPSLAAVDTPLKLSGTLTPDNASLEDITWTVKSGAAEITDSTLTASAAGTVVITAAFINGRADDFTKDFTITAKVYPAGTVIVSTNADTGAGSLRQALTSVPAGGRTIVIDPIVKTIALAGRLPTMNREITIEGNGVTLTLGDGWIEDANSQMMYFTSGGTVTISRVWFKDGRATSNGAAINVLNGNLTLESCIFSGNRTNGTSAYGGAIYNGLGTVNVKGCTFYGNSSGYTGGAIYSQGTVTLTGNLFYGNTAVNSRPVVYRLAGTVTSSGYNAVDVTMGTTSAQSGWEADTTDRQISVQPISPTSFRLLAGSDAAGVITALPAEYPAFDFYGDAITVPAAAGAVQSTASGSGYALALSVNNSVRGSVGVTSEPNIDGLYSGTVTITATPANGFGYWLVGGEKAGSTNPLALTITAHTSVQAVFAQVFTVDSNSDATGSATTAGTLRHAVTNAQDGDIVRIAFGVTSISLESRLPNITKNITIEGNGVTLTPTNEWTEGSSSQMIYLGTGGTATISRVWFKDGRATSNGAAIYNQYGNLTLESCIFSGNRTSNSFANGGAIYNGSSGTLSVKGCTFYGNSSDYYGGAVCNGGTLTLTGNLFYGNTAVNSRPVVYNGTSATTTSNGYNAVDVTMGTANTESGWEADTTDRQISSHPVSPVSFRLLTGSGAAGVITSLPVGYPALDFYGTAITAPAAAGAVQSVVSGSGYVIALSVNNSSWGSVGVTPDANADGLYSGSVTITATPSGDNVFWYWLVNGGRDERSSPLTLTITAHTSVQAVFAQVFIVDSTSDPSNTTTVGTLRHALANAQNGDIVRLSGVTPGTTSIELTSRLPNITRNITIEGNGVTLTPGAGWTEGPTSQMINITSGTVTISRVWFKDGRASAGGAITNYGNLTLESCIFSGNRATEYYGGAIENSGTLSVKGCTFYTNSAASFAGAIYGGTITLTGNLFYGNTATNYYPIVYAGLGGTVTSGGYNVVDKGLGTGDTQCGWANTTGYDTYRTTSSLSSTETFEPVPGIRDIPQSFATNMPATDFYGETRTYPNGAPGAVK